MEFTELHAAREKNGVYIPRDRFYQDEADKKVYFILSLINDVHTCSWTKYLITLSGAEQAMTEKIERVEEDLISTRKVLQWLKW